jgi:ABC-type glycerol-3-phosphate transport system substrate-binding protein
MVSLSLALLIGSVPASAKTRVTFWNYFSTTSTIGKAFAAAKEEFEKRNPDIEIEISPGNNVEKLTVAVAGGVGPDVCLMQQYVSSYALSGLIQPVTDLFNKSGLKAEDFWLPSHKENLWNGEIYAMSWGSDPNFGLFWNKRMFSEVGLDSEKPPVSIIDVDAFSRKLAKKDGDGKLVQLGINPWGIPGGNENSMYTWGWAFGGDFYDYNTGRITLDHPNNVKALEWMASYAERYGATNISALGANMGAFRTSKLGMAPMVTTEVVNIKNAAPDLDYGITYVPYNMETGQPNPAWVGGHKVFLVTGAKNREAAWRWIQWITADPEGSAIIAGPTNWFPAYKKSNIYPVYRRDRFWLPFVRLLESAHYVRPAIPTSLEMGKNMSTAVSVTIKGEQPARQALEEATRQAQMKLDEVLTKYKK